MNILFCGDKMIEDGMIICIISLLKNVDDQLNVYVLTMSLETEFKKYEPVAQDTIEYLNRYVKNIREENSVKLIDVTRIFQDEIPLANLKTRFTPYCMLRLFADKIQKLPTPIMYLDNDVICRKDCREFYNQSIDNIELVGVLDHYGKWFFRNKKFEFDYINSGVLLLNLDLIKKTGLFLKCRKMCINNKMFMPDQSAINKLSKHKRISQRKFNEQRRVSSDTVLHHFTTSFRFFPWFHTFTVKPWQINKVHKELGIYEYDDILNKYLQIKECMRGYKQ